MLGLTLLDRACPEGSLYEGLGHSENGETWSFHLDAFLEKRSGLIGIFNGVHLESIAWELTAKTMSEVTTTTTKSNTHIQVQMKPIRMEYQINDNECNTTALAVYAPIEYSAEVKGACIRITHDKTSHSLGLNGGKFHGARAISRTGTAHNVILASHDNKLSSISRIIIRVEATDWSRKVSTYECSESLPTSYNDRNHIATVFDLFQASIQKEYGATDTHISYYINQTNATIINITTPTNKQNAVFEAISSLENSRHRHTFARSSLITALPQYGQVYLYTADSKKERSKNLRQNSAAKPPFANRQSLKPHQTHHPQHQQHPQHQRQSENQTNNTALEETMTSVRKICQHVSTNLQQQNSLIHALTKSFESQQEIIQKQGHQVDLLGDKLKRLMNIVLDNFQEALEDIKELEYEEDGYSADQYPQHTSPQDVEDGGDADESKEELLQDEVVTTPKVGKYPPPKKGGMGCHQHPQNPEHLPIGQKMSRGIPHLTVASRVYQRRKVRNL